jgi:hypothetical protein
LIVDHGRIIFAIMKLLIHISCAYHDRLLNRITKASPLYYTLINGAKIALADMGGTSKFIEFICDEDEAQMLADTANQFCPEAVPQIKAGKRFPLSQTV